MGDDEQQTAVARFHHRLVAIHPFPNGNGRQSRAAADYLCNALGTAPPTWGALAHTDTAPLRTGYLTALRRTTSPARQIGPLRLPHRGRSRLRDTRRRVLLGALRAPAVPRGPLPDRRTAWSR